MLLQQGINTPVFLQVCNAIALYATLLDGERSLPTFFRSSDRSLHHHV
ncbi:hypothetical protein H6F78_20150 [Coleofasciculus sp. FACHB-64]|nr:MULTISPECIES: hypothetical protein [unclassified Coleofasciculus]MBD1841304.1 hypothetical protein [Coleofasciculus sp. FACHB-501]MBD2047873.1 hypothetical protein [Coleofasciculus sp. FACHB-64]